MQRIALVLVALFVAAMSGTASAQAAKFHSAEGSVNSDGSLSVKFDQRGVGHEDVHYELTAHVDATFACINGGGKNPSAANKRTVSSELSVAASFEPKNGRVRATITSDAPSAGDFACPNGQRMVLADAAYTNIVLTDTTNGSTVDLADASRVFLAI